MPNHVPLNTAIDSSVNTHKPPRPPAARPSRPLPRPRRVLAFGTSISRALPLALLLSLPLDLAAAANVGMDIDLAGVAPHPAGIGTGPTVQSAYAGFTDVNGNGILDCGEPVDLIATFATNNSGTPALGGSLLAPVNGSAGLTFLHGSVVIDPDLTNGCAGTVIDGNGPTDSDLRVDFSCPADPIDNNSWTLVVRYRATYTGTGTPSFAAGATANLTGGATYHDVATVPAGTSCGAGGIATRIALTKTAAGPATPGSLLLYTLTATDQSGAGAGGLQLIEVVPPHATFSAAGSSAGWVCAAPTLGRFAKHGASTAAATSGGINGTWRFGAPAPGTGGHARESGSSGNPGDAGSTCRNSIGNLNPDASLSTFFAVTLDPALPAAPVAISNTACLNAGATLAACASSSTPAAGTPTLHLAKSLAPGAPSTAVPGATLAYTLTAANTGNQDLAGATLQETVPAHTAFAAAASSPGWICAGGQTGAGTTCTLNLGPLASASWAATSSARTSGTSRLAAATGSAGTSGIATAAAAASATTFAVVVDDPLPALPPSYLVANTACLQTPAAGVLASCSTVSTPVAAQPILHAAKTLRSGTGAPGTVLLYDLAVQNTGNEDAAAVTAAETVPAHTTFTGAPSAGGAAGWICTAGPGGAGAAGTACTLAAGALAAGATTHVLFAVAVDRPLAAGVTAIANTGCFQLAPTLESAARAVSPATAAPTCDTLSTPTLGRPLLTLAKSYSGPPAAAGALLPFQLTAANTGDQDTAAVTLTETVPAHTTFAANQSTAGWSCLPAAGAAGATCSLALGPLDAGATGPGAAVTATFAVRADSPLPAGIQQIANAACATAAGLAPSCSQAASPPPATAPQAPQIAAELAYTFVKNALGNGQARAGDILAYALTVTNSNSAPAPAQGLVILIPLDPHLALDTGSVSTPAGAVTAGNARGATIPAVQIASLAPGASCTVRFDATVSALPAALRLLSTQAALTAANAPPTVSDDPSTAAPLDPTTTPVGAPPPPPPPIVQPIPTLTVWGLLALCLALAAASLRRLRSAPRTANTGSAAPGRPTMRAGHATPRPERGLSAGR
jgi:uncharacterized repeat protein (TIGR01451 family)